LLGAILQRAFENGHIPSNPARAVRKAPLPRKSEVRPLAPATIERMRAASSPRDATLISVLAYAGLRPGEALAIQWRDIREQTILVERAISLGEEKDTKLIWRCGCQGLPFEVWWSARRLGSAEGAAGLAGARRAVRLIFAGQVPQDRVSS
jgi:hypothetical protein